MVVLKIKCERENLFLLSVAPPVLPYGLVFVVMKYNSLSSNFLS